MKIDLKHLVGLLDDEMLVRKYLQQFLADMPVLINDMKRTLESHDWPQLNIHAHTLKTQLRYINVKYAAGLAQDLENKSSLPAPDREELYILIGNLDTEMNDILSEAEFIV